MSQLAALVSAVLADPRHEKSVIAIMRRVMSRGMERPAGTANDDPLDVLVPFSIAAGEVGLSRDHVRNAVALGYADGMLEKGLVNKRSLIEYIDERMPSLPFDMAQEVEAQPETKKTSRPQIKEGPKGSISYIEAAGILGQKYGDVTMHIRMGRLKKAARGYVWKKKVEELAEKRSALPGARLRVVPMEEVTKPSVPSPDAIAAAATPPVQVGGVAAR